jgi:hypothetical protein
MQMRAGVAKKTIRSIRQQAFEATHLFDSHPESSLDFEKVRAAVKDGYEKPDSRSLPSPSWIFCSRWAFPRPMSSTPIR